MANTILPRTNDAARTYTTATLAKTGKDAKFVELSVTVNDAALRRQGHQFDGLEQAFALVPTRNGQNQVEWQRVDLSFAYRSSDRGGGMYDTHSMRYEPKGVRAEDLQNLGVAYGLKTNTGDVWLQYANDNHKAEIKK
jgi:hypothetical protein